MAKKKRARKSGPVWHLSTEEATLSKMPKYNGHACGSGVHGDTKYNRTKQKRAWKKQLSQEARTRGPLLLGHDRVGHDRGRSKRHDRMQRDERSAVERQRGQGSNIRMRQATS